MLAGATGTDEPVLRALIAFDLGVRERGPIGLLVFEAPDIFFHDFFEWNAFELLGARMSCNAHRRILPALSSLVAPRRNLNRRRGLRRRAARARP